MEDKIKISKELKGMLINNITLNDLQGDLIRLINKLDKEIYPNSEDKKLCK